MGGARPRGQLRPRREQLGVGSVRVSALEKRLVNRALNTNRLSYGPFTRRFERRFARLHGRRYAIFMNSGTSALQVALHALKGARGWADGDEVLVPALTFVATVNVVLQNRLRPVFVDVDPLYFGMDPSLLAAAATPRTRAVIPVHLFGQPCDIGPINDFARARGLAVLEDSCETMFARYRGRPVGSFGDAACFSTYAAHILVTGVGGLALTDDAELAVTMKSLANHGRDAIYTSMDDDRVSDDAELFRIVARRFAFVDVGYSYRATELEAALGLGQLARWRTIVRKRQGNARRLTQALRPLADVLQLPRIRPGSEHAFMVYPLVLADGIEREALVRHLESYRVETRYLLPLLSQPVYRTLFGDIGQRYPNAARIERQGFYVGCHPEMTARDVAYVARVLAEYFRDGAGLQRGRRSG